MRNGSGWYVMAALCAALWVIPGLAADGDAMNQAGEGAMAPSPGLWPSSWEDSGALDEIILNESFDNTPNGQLPAGWSQVSVDSGVNSDIFRGGATIWQAISRTGISTHTGSGVCVNAYNSSGAANNDWLILPRVPALDPPLSLSYWVSSQDTRHLESFEIRLSTTGNNLGDFSQLIASTENTPHLWTAYTHDLSAYAGAPFYVAVHYTSVNEYLIKLDDVELTGTRLAADERGADLPADFQFTGNYPNPFNSQTDFHFDLPRPERVSLILYNMLGQDVACLVQQPLNAGTHVVTFNAGSLTSGVYFARLSAGRFNQTRKVVLVK
jgi:hypothetical protein